MGNQENVYAPLLVLHWGVCKHEYKIMQSVIFLFGFQWSFLSIIFFPSSCCLPQEQSYLISAHLLSKSQWLSMEPGLNESQDSFPELHDHWIQRCKFESSFLWQMKLYHI